MVFFYNQGLTSLSSLATYAIVPGSLATMSLYQTALFEAIFTEKRVAQKSVDVKIKEKCLGLLLNNPCFLGMLSTFFLV